MNKQTILEYICYASIIIYCIVSIALNIIEIVYKRKGEGIDKKRKIYN